MYDPAYRLREAQKQQEETASWVNPEIEEWEGRGREAARGNWEPIGPHIDNDLESALRMREHYLAQYNEKHMDDFLYTEYQRRAAELTQQIEAAVQTGADTTQLRKDRDTAGEEMAKTEKGQAQKDLKRTNDEIKLLERAKAAKDNGLERQRASNPQ
jgi:hypothetical protein